MLQIPETIDKEKIINTLTLKIFNISTKPRNYRILQMLPSDVNAIMKEIKINKINTNARINQMEKIGLVTRKRGTGEVYGTKISENVIKLLELIKKDIGISLNKLLEA